MSMPLTLDVFDDTKDVSNHEEDARRNRAPEDDAPLVCLAAREETGGRPGKGAVGSVPGLRVTPADAHRKEGEKAAEKQEGGCL